MADIDPPTINPNAVAVFDNTGLVLPTLPELLQNANDLSEQIQPGVSTNSNSPVGQDNANKSLTIFESNTLLAQFQSSMDPGSATGIAQDNLYAIIGLVRSPATFTLQNISVVIGTPCNLEGLDANANDINGVGFTVADQVGNKYILLNSQIGLLPGTYVFAFRAQDVGQIQSIPNTITTIVTIINGVVSVNNPLSPLSIGQLGETDPEFRQRQQSSVAMAANGSYNGLESKLSALEGVAYQPALTTPTGTSKPIVFIDNNNSDSVNQYGTPPHSVWVIMQGGVDDDIALTIAGCVSLGCGIYGGSSPVYKTVVSQTGNLIRVAFGRPIQVAVFLKLTLTKINSSSVDNTVVPDLINSIVLNGIYGIGQVISIGNVMPVVNNAILDLAPNQLTISLCELSLNGVNWFGELEPSNIDVKFAFDVNQIQITIA
jgi:hypothetical protein